MMDIENILKDYNRKKGIVDTTLARIEQYKYALGHPDIIMERQYSVSSREVGMPGAPLRNTSSSVEKIVTDKELTVEVIREWIREDESRIFLLKLEVDQIEIALSCLTEPEEFIVRSKYLDIMFWKDIEKNYNDKFRQKNYVTYERLKKLNKEALKKLEEMLNPFYSQHKTA